ncbi:MAG: hypothetical protein M9949_14125 [Candidatus Kapabacteria bacterium]|nr:hypothetical protein [Candidatus Kapabacteria bacterium]
MNKLIKSILLFSVILLSLSSCDTAKYIYENVSITWKPLEAQRNTAPIDSIVVRYEPVYWTEPPCMDGSTNEVEYEILKDGNLIWCLDNPFARRREVLIKDTVIYIYRK